MKKSSLFFIVFWIAHTFVFQSTLKAAMTTSASVKGAKEVDYTTEVMLIAPPLSRKFVFDCIGRYPNVKDLICKDLGTKALQLILKRREAAGINPLLLTSITFDCCEITRELLSDFVLRCPGLKKIRYRMTSGQPNFNELIKSGIGQGFILSHCFYLIDDDLYLLAPLFSDVILFVLWSSHAITDIGLKHLAEGCRRPIIMGLSGSGITDVGLKYLAGGCKELFSIDLSGCCITDVGLKDLAEGCKKLKTIDFDHCDKITYDGLIYLAEYCKKLFTIGIKFCKNITIKEANALSRAYPVLSIRI